jgi:hypothetical protein
LSIATIKNRFLCSCRSSVYQYNLKQFVDAVVLPLTPLQVQHFVHQWAIARPITRPIACRPIDNQSETSSPRDLDSPEAPVITDVTATQTSPTAIQSEENTTDQTRTADTVPETITDTITDTITHDPDLTELSRSPLLLTLFNLTDPASLERLHNRPFLYQEIIELYLRTWSDLKRVPRSPIYPDFGVTLQQQFFSEIALKASRNQQIFLARRELVEALKSFLQTRLQAPDYLDGDAILDAIVVQQGILTERSRDVFSFDHVALQAYCAATALGDQASNQGLGDREIETIAAQYLGDPLWRSIFPLWVDRLGRRGAVLLHALEKAAKKGQDSGVVAWLAAQDETIAIESVSLDQLQPWRSVLSQGSIAPIAIGLAAMANRIDSVDRIPDRPDGSGDGESSRLGQSFRQLWTVLQTDVLAGVGTREPTAVGWQALALYLVSLETIARCRLMVNTEA